MKITGKINEWNVLHQEFTLLTDHDNMRRGGV